MPTEHTPPPWQAEHPPGGGHTIVARLPFHPYGKDSDFWKVEQNKWYTIFRLPRLQDVRIHIAEDGNFYMHLAYEDWCQFPCQEWKEMQRANAEFIVRSVNSHEQLLEALLATTSALAAIDDYGAAAGLSPDIRNVALDAARAAIAKAKGE